MAKQERGRGPRGQLRRPHASRLPCVADEQCRRDRKHQHLRIAIQLGGREQRRDGDECRARLARELGGGSSGERQRECEQANGEDRLGEERFAEETLGERRQFVGQCGPGTHHTGIGEIPERPLAMRDRRCAQVVDEVIAVEAAERTAERVEAVQECQHEQMTTGTTSACRTLRRIA